MCNRHDREKEIKNMEYLELKSIFDTKEYQDYKKLDWNRYRDKDEFDFNDWREYEKVKSDDLKENFTFNSELDFDAFLITIDNTQSVKSSVHSQIENSLEIIMSENFVQNNDLGLLLLKAYLKKDYAIGALYKTISSIVNHSASFSLKLWELLDSWDNKNCIYWKLHFLAILPKEYINDSYYKRLIKTIYSLNSFTYLYLDQYIKYSNKSRNAVKEVMCIVHDKIKTKTCNIRLSEYPFKDGLELLENDYFLIRESYFQQFVLAKSSFSFDYKREGFANIYEKHQEFLLDFFSYFFSINKLHGHDKNIALSFIWDYPDRTNEIEKVIDYLMHNDFYIGLGGHSVSILFNDLNEKQLQTAFVFIKKIIKKNLSNSNYIEVIFDVIRTNLQVKHNELFLYFLSLNNDVDFLKL